MESLRIPDERFANLPDYDFEPNYIDVGGMRMHYVDVGEGFAIPQWTIDETDDQPTPWRYRDGHGAR